jgi:hypothetical protein
MKQTPTSPYAPDLEELRSWLENRVATMKLVATKAGFGPAKIKVDGFAIRATVVVVAAAAAVLSGEQLPSSSRRWQQGDRIGSSGEAASTDSGGGRRPAAARRAARSDGCHCLTSSCYEGAGRRARDSNPASGVGNNFERHATLHANDRKFGSKWFGSLSPLVPVSRRESSGVGQGLGSGWAAQHPGPMNRRDVDSTNG